MMTDSEDNFMISYNLNKPVPKIVKAILKNGDISEVVCEDIKGKFHLKNESNILWN